MLRGVMTELSHWVFHQLQLKQHVIFIIQSDSFLNGIPVEIPCRSQKLDSKNLVLRSDLMGIMEGKLHLT